MAKKIVNLAGVRAARDKAKPVRRTTAPPGNDNAEPAGLELPPDCPVVPLGKDGKIRYYLDADRQLIGLAERDHSRLGVLGLFGQQYPLLYTYWPRHNKDGDITGWRPELASEALMAACSRAGVWDARERQRGRGAWLGDDGELVLHTGAHVMTFPASGQPYREHTAHRAGLVGRYVYGSAASLGVPSSQDVEDGPDGPAQKLLEVLRTWQWRRGEIDAILLLGWIGAAMIGGALKWRPMMWLTGGAGTGKSTLQHLIQSLFGGALVVTSETSEAGLRNVLKSQTLPIALDEQEAQADNRKSDAVVKLARQAASGGMVLRGSADHTAVEFVVRSAFLFSSILIPPLTQQDRTRISVLELDALVAGAVEPKIDAKVYAAIGSQLRRRLVDRWGSWQAVLSAYRAALQAAGHTARAADQLGTLLAAADVMLADDHAPGDADAWVRKLNDSELAEADENQRDEERCLAQLMSSPADVFRGGVRKSIGEWLRLAAAVDGTDDDVESDAHRVLGGYGLKIMPATPGEHGRPGLPMMLAVAHYHRGLAAVYQDSHWQGTAATMGVWVQALRRLPGAERSRRTLYFAGATSKAVLVPLSVVLPLDSVAASHHGRLLRRG